MWMSSMSWSAPEIRSPRLESSNSSASLPGCGLLCAHTQANPQHASVMHSPIAPANLASPWDVCECMLIRPSAPWLIPFTLVYLPTRGQAQLHGNPAIMLPYNFLESGVVGPDN